MSEPINDFASGASGETTNTTPMRAGAMLRLAREAQGLHIGALAVALKVPVKKLEALESDCFDQLPDIVFVRALALSVCRVLKLDPTPIMNCLPQLQTPQIKTDESGLNASFKGSGHNSAGVFFAQLANPVGIGVLVVALAIAGVLFWPAKPAAVQSMKSDADIKQVSLAESAAPTTSTPSEMVSEATLSSKPELAVSNSGATPDLASIQTAIPASTTAATNAVGENTILSLTARGPSWVEVTDAKGTTQLRKITSNGEVLQVPGVSPLAVVVGRSDLVTVSVRGKPFDLAAVSKDNVARFEVK